MIQLREYEVYDFNELVIEELRDVYLLRIINDSSLELTIRYEKDLQNNKILDVIYMFLEIGHINVVNNRLPVIRCARKKNYAEIVNLDNKKLSMYIYDIRFRSVYDLIIKKYINDRDIFLESDNTMEVRLSDSSQNVMYKKDNGCLNITLCTDSRGNIMNSEMEFITQYLYNKFSLIGEDVYVDIVNEKELESEFIIRCGEFKVVFPRKYTYSPIVSVVCNYNKVKKKKRK